MTSLVLLIALGCRNDKDLVDTGSIGDCADGSAPITYYLDQDGDGFGQAGTGVEACEAPSGQVADGSDCDDADASVFPGAEEICDGLDQDCDGVLDNEAVDQGSWYVDADGDGYGESATLVLACEAPSGTVDQGDDCDDSAAAVYPGAPEEDCADPVDYNCDGSVAYADADGDGFAACEECDDADPSVNPGAQEICDGLDDDCDGAIDDADESLDSGTGSEWFGDVDGDGYGDAVVSMWACVQPAGAVADSGDCDDSDAAVNPAASEICDAVDNDCDGDIDDADSSLDVSSATTWYEDSDSDGYGSVDRSKVSCSAPTGSVADASDCDDGDSAINPAATEVCDEVDNDCDGDVDDADSSLDSSTASAWYSDSDGDGYGDAGSSFLTCEAPSATVSDDTDCDDSDSSVSPGVSETWYDGVDSDCDGASDYDADGDGDDSIDYGGTDCDDSDSAVYGGVGCRPSVSCTQPDPTTLATNDPSGVSDIVFDDSCNAVLGTVISGADYVYVMDSTGANTIYYGYSNYNINSVAIDPNTGSLIAGYSSTQGIGYEAGTSLSVLATSGGGFVGYGVGPFSNAYMDDAPAALAMDTSGCIWTPNWGSLGELACVDTSGGVSTLTLGTDNIMSVALDSSEALYAAIGDTIYQVDTSTGSLTTVFTASDEILDFVFDYNDDIYVESADDVLTLVLADLSSSSTYASISGDAKLAISPDGFLVRMMGAPTGAATYEEFDLN